MERFEKIQKLVHDFNEERDWDQFHSPVNLAKSVCIEAGELLECFQWDDENFDREAVADEMADVFTYILDMSERLDIDLLEATEKKMAKNIAKYPVEKARGKNTKYDRL